MAGCAAPCYNLRDCPCPICCVCFGLHTQGESIDKFEVQSGKRLWHVCACAWSCFLLCDVDRSEWYIQVQDMMCVRRDMVVRSVV